MTRLDCIECIEPAELQAVTMERDMLRDALNELWMAGLVLVPHVGYIDAGVSIRWDEAMGAAAIALGQEKP